MNTTTINVNEMRKEIKDLRRDVVEVVAKKTKRATLSKEELTALKKLVPIIELEGSTMKYCLNNTNGEAKKDLIAVHLSVGPAKENFLQFNASKDNILKALETGVLGPKLVLLFKKYLQSLIAIALIITITSTAHASWSLVAPEKDGGKTPFTRAELDKLESSTIPTCAKNGRTFLDANRAMRAIWPRLKDLKSACGTGEVAIGMAMAKGVHVQVFDTRFMK